MPRTQGYRSSDHLIAEKAQTNIVQLQTPPDQIWPVRSKRRAITQDPDKEGHAGKTTCIRKFHSCCRDFVRAA